MEIDIKNNQQEMPEDKVIYAPLDFIISIEQIISNLETAHKEFQFVAQNMKPVMD